MSLVGALPAVVAHTKLTKTVLTYPYVCYQGAINRHIPILLEKGIALVEVILLVGEADESIDCVLNLTTLSQILCLCSNFIQSNKGNKHAPVFSISVCSCNLCPAV